MLGSRCQTKHYQTFRYQALELTYAKFAQIKKAKAMASDWLDTFESIEKNGAFYTIESEEKDNE